MCSRFKSVTDANRMAQFFKAAMPDGVRADIWPTYESAYIVADGAGSRRVQLGQFGLLPHWAKDSTFGRHTYNARSETVAEKPSFRDAWLRGQRCIIPAEAIYEPQWQGGKAQSTAIARADGYPMGIAGLWSQWQDKLSFTMLTVNADDHAFMRHFHKPQDEKRMVVILPMGAYRDWLNPATDAQAFMLQYPAERLQVQV